MKTYNLVGYAVLIVHAVVSAALAPPWMGPWLGIAIGCLYLVLVTFVGGIYLSDVIHMGITHGALDYRPWFIKAVTLLNNTLGIYINPVTWVNRHRHHHTFSDHSGDPNKLDGDGFWKTMYLCLFPYRCESDLAPDAILKSWPFRLVASRFFALFAQFTSYGALWLVVRDWKYALGVWFSVRVFALWVNLVQNYWTHNRRFGSRRYDDPGDNAMNIDDWLPVTATFSACLQNNHHHYPHLLRLSHDTSEYDFGFLTVRMMKAIGLVRASPTGANVPLDLPLRDLGF